MPYMIGLDNALTSTLFILSIIIALYAQSKIKRTYKEYRTELTKKGLSGQEVARLILNKNGLGDMYVLKTRGELTDHYDPRNKSIKLSSDIFDGTSISSIAVAAHEVGHAIQDKEGYKPMRVRSALVPFVNLISKLSYFIIIISLVLGLLNYFYIAILMISVTLIFQLVTLPVEFDASKRALEELKSLGLASDDEIDGCRDVLKAAAFTYVASVITSILNILRLLIMSDRN